MKETWRWHSPHLEREVGVARWGCVGTPVLLFQTAGGDAEECERFLMIDALAPLLAARRLKVYGCDSVASRAWISGRRTPRECSWLQNRFDEFVHRELVPLIRHDCRTPGLAILAAGASLGALAALASLCRHPEDFRAAVCLSGTFDLEPWLAGPMDLDFYYSSPPHFLPALEEGALLRSLRERFVVLATGSGQAERHENSRRMAQVLRDKSIPHRLDFWGSRWDHDWTSWRWALPRYLAELTGPP